MQGMLQALQVNIEEFVKLFKPIAKNRRVDYVCNFTEEDVFYGSIQNTGNDGVERYRRSMGNHEDLRVRR